MRDNQDVFDEFIILWRAVDDARLNGEFVNGYRQRDALICIALVTDCTRTQFCNYFAKILGFRWSVVGGAYKTAYNIRRSQ
jgi:hypothetical protein